MSEEKKYPKVIVGAFIFNDKDELFLMKGTKWHGKYIVPGGKVEMNETIEDALKREVKEETNLDIEDIKLIGLTDGLGLDKAYTKEDNHFVFVDNKAFAKDIKNIKLNDEASEYKWLKLDEWLKKDKAKFGPYIYHILEKLKDGEENFEHKYKKALADYQNLLKRTAVEKQEFVKYANEQFLYEILPVYDNLKLAVAHANVGANKTDAVIEGVKYVLGQFKNILENFGVKEIKTVGEKFDHNTMEAIEKKETDDEEKDGMVESEVMPGYVLGERVIRAARVVVFEVKHE
jgi:molecular chaperone GrpE (heat shock protein)